MTNQIFQVNLQGMIDLLSNHLYSNPGVFVRELLQNAVDAITARKKCGHKFEEKITFEIYESARTIAVHDNGIGMNEAEIMTFLSQIGHTSKKENPDESDDYIGQFGVGLLACFIVSDEIVIITRSALEGDSYEWKARPDGTFSIRKLKKEVPVGTSVYLTCKSEEYEEFFEYYRLYDLLTAYGEFLETPVYLVEDRYEERINTAVPPWKMDREEALKFAESHLHKNCLEVIPLRSMIGETEGVAYVVSHQVNLHEQRNHKVYLKNLLLSEKLDDILPPWAFFITCIINTNGLRPTASRESLYENDLLLSVRDEMGECIQRHLKKLADADRALFEKIIRIHYKSLKNVAVENDELYQLFIPYFEFETSYGQLELQEIVKMNKKILLTTTLDEFRQISRVARAQDLMVINGGYAHDYDLIMNLNTVYSNIEAEIVNPTQFFQRFVELDREDAGETMPLLQLAGQILEPFRCKPSIRWFEPSDVPVLYTTNAEITFLRMAEESQAETNDLFKGIIHTVTSEMYDVPYANLCLNYNNPIIRKIARCSDERLQKLCIEVLYTQALLMGNYPLNSSEIKLLNESFIQFINLGLDMQRGGMP